MIVWLVDPPLVSSAGLPRAAPTRPDPVESESFAQRVSPLLRSKRAFLRRG
jgi:hypothetical protein